MGDTNRLPGGDQPESQIMLLNIVDVVGQFGKSLNVPEIPIDDLPIILMAVCGTLSENIDDDTWKKIIDHGFQPCGEPGCDCHEHANRFIPELRQLKTVAKEKQHEKRMREGRGLN